MTAVRGLLPGRLLASAGPLPRHPPTADFGQLGWVLEIDDDDDVSEIAVCGRREIGVALIEIEAVHALPAGFPSAQQMRFARVGHVVNVGAALPISRRRVRIVEVEFLIDDHGVAGHAYLVRMRAGRHFQLGHDNRIFRIAHVDDGGAVGRAHVTDEGEAIADDDLAAAGHVDVTHLPHAKRL